ncbi:MAG: methylamine utilization protein MauG [Hyphomicrobiales bacterium]|nr:MAG: methylamine utilization protein MauG [Hyphomicrobiales bacterium]
MTARFDTSDTEKSPFRKLAVASVAVAGLTLCSAGAFAADADGAIPGLPAAPYTTVETLGSALFFDLNLSKNRSQSCATCHDPEIAFVDPRGDAVSLGDDGTSLGDRNAPTAAYSSFSPAFHKTKAGIFAGGQFHDGREPDLAGQAGGPPLNPIEMGMPDKASVVARLMENADYVTAFKALYGDDIFTEADTAYAAMTKSIAAFEMTPAFAPFDSKYDRYLRGEVKLTAEEELGQVLFFSAQFTNCNLCHQLRKTPGAAKETFSNYEFHNIGVPENRAVRAINGVAKGFKDRGLLENPAIDDQSQAGKIKVPTLRNVAVTGPYMHNGVFEDLRTVILFYDKYNSKDPKRAINPETGQPWAPPEIDGTLSMKELETGPALDDKRVDALVAFLKTLTDRRYERLLDQ